MPVKYPEYGNCIANLACSVLNYYGITPPNPTLPQADQLLCREYKNVVLLLLDGMGMNILERHLSADGFFRRNLISDYSSTFPPTTVAATTAVYSGLYPNQSAWLGWTGYFPEIEKNVIYFWNIDTDTGDPVDGLNVAQTYVPYENICDRIAATGIGAHYLAPFREPHPGNFGELCGEIERLCGADGRKYVYAYWDEPDHSMHDYGIDGDIIRQTVTDIEARVEKMAGRLEDTLLIITADHGHINIKNTVITDYSDIADCLVRMPSMEARALNLFVRDGMAEQFESAFRSHFGDSFMLIPKAKLLAMGLFGLGQDHERLEGMLGDYIAIAVSDVTICNEEGGFAGGHAGMTAEEMTIPLIAVEIG